MTLEQIRFDLPRMKASSRERSSKSSRTPDAFSAIENSRLSRRREKKKRRKVCDIIRSSANRIARDCHSSRCTLLGPRRDVRRGERKPIFVRVLRRQRGWTARDFRGKRWLSTDDGSGGGRVASRRLEKCRPRGRLPPGEVRSSSMSLFPLSGAGGTQHAAFLQKCRGFEHSQIVLPSAFSGTKNTQ